MKKSKDYYRVISHDIRVSQGYVVVAYSISKDLSNILLEGFLFLAADSSSSSPKVVVVVVVVIKLENCYLIAT